MILRRLNTACCMLGLSALIGSAMPTQAQTADKVVVAMTGGLADAPVIVAQERGYFRAVNINLEKVVFASAAQTIVPLAAKQIDVVGGATSAGLYSAVERGVLIKAVADRSHTSDGIPYITMFVRKDLVDSGRFKSLKDLKGMKFAIVAKGITVHALLDAGLQSAGLKFGDVDIVYMNYTNQVLAFKNRALEASLMGEPHATDLVSSGYGVRFMNTNDFFPNYVVTVFHYGETMLRDKPDVGKRFMIALMRGARDYNDALDDKGLLSKGNDDIVAAFEREFKMPAAMIRTVYSHSVDPNGSINMKSLAADWDFMTREKLISGNIKPDALVDPSFARHAVEALGPYTRKK